MADMGNLGGGTKAEARYAWKKQEAPLTSTPTSCTMRDEIYHIDFTTITVGDSVTWSVEGTPTLVNPTTIAINAGSTAAVGKYYREGFLSALYYITGAIVYGNTPANQVSRPLGAITFVVSDDVSKYPSKGIDGNHAYTKIAE
jgi:hypothetical protein